MAPSRPLAAFALTIGAALGVLGCPKTDFTLPTVNANFQDVAGRGSTTLAIGTNGRTYQKNDNGNWYALPLVSFSPLRRIVGDATTALVVGADGVILRGSWQNGDDWKEWDLGRQIGAPDFVAASVCARYAYAVGGSGWALYQATGSTNWERAKGMDATADLVGVACAPSTVLLASQKQSSGHWLTTDGTAFTKVPSPGDTCGIGFGNGVFIDVTVDGKVYHSPDAQAWIEAPNVNAWKHVVDACDVAFGAGTFAVVSETTIIVSADGTTWTTFEVDEAIEGIDIDENGQLEAVGSGGAWFETHCNAGVCDPPTKKTAKILASQADAVSSSGGTTGSSGSPGSSGSSGGACTDGWIGSEDSCEPLGSGGSCQCGGYPKNTCITRADFQTATGGHTLPAACLPEGAIGCMDQSAPGVLLNPCCAGLSCSLCGSGGSKSGGQCVVNP